MNQTIYRYGNEAILVDCGLMFSDATRLGTDAVIPAPFYSEDSDWDLHAYVITHGHEDHIGALPFQLARVHRPVYGTEWTIALIKERCIRANVAAPDLRIVKPGETINLGSFKIKYLAVNHSIPMACALVIDAGSRRVFQTGDFKFDPRNPYEKPIKAQDYAEYGPVDVLYADSTNAMSEGPSPSEGDVIKPLSEIVAAATSATFITTFASNLWRLMAITDICRRHKKKLHLAGRGIEQTITMALELKMIDSISDVLVDEHEVGNVPRDQLVVAISGCQGEWRAGLTRLATDEHRYLQIEPGDHVVFSSRVIPGNERPILNVIDGLLRQGARVTTSRDQPSIHVSGHAYGKDLSDLIHVLKPRALVPVHGSRMHQIAHSEVATSTNYTGPIVVPDSGDALYFKNNKLEKRSLMPRDTVYVESESRRTIALDNLRERLRIGQNGMAIVTGIFKHKSNKWIREPSIHFAGLAGSEHEIVDWEHYIAKEIIKKIGSLSKQVAVDSELINETSRLVCRRYLTDILKKKPVVYARIQVL
jgi:ribonuclease J